MDILTIDAGVIVQQVNTLGVMGAGLAKQIADKWPVVARRYKEQYKNHSLGSVLLVNVSPGVMVANVFAQNTIGRRGLHTSYEALYNGLQYLSYLLPPHQPQVYIPQGLGCGLGGGHWGVVESIIARTLPDAMIVSLSRAEPYPVMAP